MKSLHKIIKLTTFLTALIVLAAGCKREFLETAPYDQISSSNFWQTESDALMGLTGIYSHTSTGTESDFLSYTYFVFNDQKSDNGFELPSGIRESFIDGTDNPTNSIIASSWKGSYTRIARANYFLENVDKVAMDDTKRNVMKAEARFFRAVYYFYMTQYWGGVPLVTKVLTIDEANTMPRNTKAEVVNFVLSEMGEIAGILPATRPSSENGRITKGAALAFKGRLEMAEGKWSDAAATWKSIMDLGVYGIAPDYMKMFIAGNEKNNELVFFLPYIANVGSKYSSQVPYRYWPRIWGGVSQMGPTNSLVEAYGCTDGKSITESPLYDPNNPWEKNGVRYRDPRLYYTILLPNYSTINGKLYVTHPDSANAPDKMTTYSKTGYGIMKYVDPAYTGDPKLYGHAFPVIRYAEVLLSYLESTLEAGTPITQSILDASINLVRARPGVNMPPITETDPTKLREIVRNERRVEFGMEGIRQWDIYRWHIAHIVLKGDVYGSRVCNSPSGCGFTVDAGGHYKLYTRNFRENVDYLWPIPQSERDLNHNLEQNPGYQ